MGKFGRQWNCAVTATQICKMRPVISLSYVQGRPVSEQVVSSTAGRSPENYPQVLDLARCRVPHVLFQPMQLSLVGFLGLLSLRFSFLFEEACGVMISFLRSIQAQRNDQYGKLFPSSRNGRAAQVTLVGQNARRREGNLDQSPFGLLALEGERCTIGLDQRLGQRQT